MIGLRVRLGRLELKNPVLAASETFGYVREMASFVRIGRLGGDFQDGDVSTEGG